MDDIQGDIELRDVYFAYPTRPDEPILSGFSLSIQKGKTSALVGHSGSGKSTIISLIERFYDPQSGEVVIDGINIKDFQLKWIRDKISLVSQEPVLFTGTIKDNIAYGKTGATIQEIRAVVELANAAKFIDTFPKVNLPFFFSYFIVKYLYFVYVISLKSSNKRINIKSILVTQSKRNDLFSVEDFLPAIEPNVHFSYFSKFIPHSTIIFGLTLIH